MWSPLSTTALLSLLTLPTLILAQVPSPLPSAIVQWSTLPTCAQNCGPLYDAQGACAPPVLAQVSISCFCQYPSLQSFFTTPTAVCPAACPNDPNGLAFVQSWFQGICGVGSTTTAAAGGTTTTPTAAGTHTGSTSTGSSTSAPVNGGGSTVNNGSSGSWISTHWKWIVMLVVIVIGLTAIWIGACLLRRRYIRKKELQYELRPPAVPWAQDSLKRQHNSPYGDGVFTSPEPGVGNGKKTVTRAGPEYVATPADSRKTSPKEKKKWVVKERT